MSGGTGVVSGAGRTGNKVPSGYRSAQVQNFTPEQMQLFQQMFGNLGPQSFMGKLAAGDQSQFEQLEAPAMRQFGEMQGNLASRFSGMGTGARRSSGFQNTMTSAASDFAQQLQSQRMGLQTQAVKDLMSMSNDLLNQRPFDQQFVQKQIPFWKQLLGGVAGGVGQGIGSGFGIWGMKKAGLF